MSNGWFTADREGLRKIADRHGRARLIAELVSNSFDAGAKVVNVSLAGRGRERWLLTVEDDGVGFKDIDAAWTLFGRSSSADDPEKRGRFCLGEKLFLSICDWASVHTTCGIVDFALLEDGREDRIVKRDAGSRRRKGTVVSAHIRLTKDERREVSEFLTSLIPPAGVTYVVEGVAVDRPEMVNEFEISLPTEIPDDEQALRRTRRKTPVTLYRPRLGEKPKLLELGVPVMDLEDGDPFLIDVLQKVPLTMDRTSVPLSFLGELRGAVVAHAWDSVGAIEVLNGPWIATADLSAAPAKAIEAIIRAAHGNRVVFRDPSDVEAEKTCVSQGYTVIGGNQITASVRERVKSLRAEGVDLVPAAGKVCPTVTLRQVDGAPPLQIMTDAELPEAQVLIRKYMQAVGRLILSDLKVQIVRGPQPIEGAYYKDERRMIVNAQQLGNLWFEGAFARGRALELLIHELGHEWSSDHLSREYHDALCRIGSDLALLALAHPEVLYGGDPQ